MLSFPRHAAPFSGERGHTRWVRTVGNGAGGGPSAHSLSKNRVSSTPQCSRRNRRVQTGSSCPDGAISRSDRRAPSGSGIRTPIGRACSGIRAWLRTSRSGPMFGGRGHPNARFPADPLKIGADLPAGCSPDAAARDEDDLDVRGQASPRQPERLPEQPLRTIAVNRVMEGPFRNNNAGPSAGFRPPVQPQNHLFPAKGTFCGKDGRITR